MNKVRVNLVLDASAGGALWYFSESIAVNSRSCEIRLVDHREKAPPPADVTHYVAWYLYRDAPIKPPPSRCIITIHHLLGPNAVVQRLIETGVPLVTMSMEWHRFLRGMGADPGKVSIVPHGVDCERWDESGFVKRALEPFSVGVIGRVYEDGRKRDDLVWKLMAQLKPGELEMVIVGQGWENCVNRLLTQGHKVRYYPSLSAEALRTAVHRLSVFLCTSDVEGGPLPLLETMACGVTPVSTPVGLARDLLRRTELGYLFPKGNPYAAASVLRQLLSGKKPLVEPYRFRNAVQALSWSVSARGYEEIYQALSAGHPLPADPTGYQKKLRELRRGHEGNLWEVIALLANPSPGNRWTQPALWRAWNKLIRQVRPSLSECIMN